MPSNPPKTTACYLCGGNSHRERGAARDNPGLKVLECTNCGLVFLRSFDHIDAAHYESSAMHGSVPLPVDKWLQEAEADDDRRFRFLQSTVTGRNLLDFGCGAGGFLLKARAVAATAKGIEPELRLQPFFKKAGLDVGTNINQLMGTGSPRFDVVTAFHVVEHLPDPRSVLANLASLLTADGELVIEVPSSDDALLTLFACDPFARFTYWSQHLFLFNNRTLADLVRQAGLTMRWVKQVQRYPLSNHLHWLARGEPGGHKKWAFLDSPALHDAYCAQLAALGQCDTIMAGIVIDGRTQAPA